MGKDEWLTPQYIIEDLGPFDLDPCSPIDRPWPTAKEHLTIKDDGLWPTWDSWKFIWCNPPYGDHVGDWLEKLADHGSGIALVFARTETEWFFRTVWHRASCLLFLKKRITFCHVDGTPGKYTGGAPSVLIGYGLEAKNKLRKSKLDGYLVDLRN
jgi:hypothetical protein